MSTRGFIYILVLLTMLSSNSGAKEFASAATVFSQYHQPHRYRLHRGVAYRRSMSFGTKVGACFCIPGALILDALSYSTQPGTLSATLTAYSLAGVAVGLVLIHFGSRHERNHPEKFMFASYPRPRKFRR